MNRIVILAGHLGLLCANALAAGILCQWLVSIALPQVQVAFLDDGVFRSRAGFGVHETLTLSVILPLLALARGGHETRHPSSGFRHLVVGVACGSLATALIVYLTLRVPLTVVFVYAVQALVQLAVVCWTVRVIRGTPQGKRRIATLSVVVGVSLLSVSWAFPTPRPTETFVVQTEGIGPAHVDCFLPGGPGPHRAILVLHGVEGATPLVRRAFHYPNAKAISQQGYAVFFLRYFDAFPYDHLLLRTDGLLDLDKVEVQRKEDFRKWIATAREAMERIRSRADVGEMAIIGYSLGCYVGSAACAETCDHGYPHAFVGNFGGIWPEITLPRNFPPSRFFHGEEDSVIPLEYALNAVNRLRDAGASDTELITFPRQGHVPQGPTVEVIRARTEAFLLEQLPHRGS